MKEIKTLRDIPEEHLLIGGSPTCPGCGPEIGLKLTLKALGPDTVVVNSAGCMTLLCNYPYTPLKVSWIHSAIENADATATGIIRALKARNRKMNVICYAGDGASYEIGMGSLSGAATRNDPVIHICYNNACYGNTGDQWNPATPHYANTTTTPVTEKSSGNPWYKKDMVKIMAAHGCYAATACLSKPADYMNKLKKAKESGGFAFIDLFGSCPTNWGFDSSKTVEVDRLAVETCFWPLYEISGGKLTVNYKPTQIKSVVEFLKTQGRYKHLTKKQIEEMQGLVSGNWKKLLAEENRA
ncbi:MAG: thiamine pyrophosphate-dependent enzyme [Candidatus Micrarchaeota archaeon]